MAVGARFTVNVPRPQLKVFTWLSGLTNEAFSSLSAAFDSPEPTNSLAALRQRVRTQVPETETVDPDLFLDALLGASSARIWKNASSQEVAQAIVRFPDLDIDPEQQDRLASRITTLLDSQSLATLSKGLDVLTEHERVYLKARLVTDLRPVYSSANVSDPAAIVLVHTLRLDVQESGQMKSLYVAMDESDLQQLRAVLDREADKTSGLKSKIPINLPLLDFEDEEDAAPETDK